MDKENLLQAKVNQKFTSSERLKPSYHEALERELWESLSKIEHRAEILIAISQNQRTSGRYELAEAYRKQAMKSKAYAQSIRKLLMGFSLIREEG
jgi:hypothetical protein